MKKLFFLIWLAMLLWQPFFTNADWFKTITLAPWWNVVSTPWILSNITYSNGWGWLSFFKLSWGSWQSVAWNITNIKPLQWFLVNNSNNSNVIMSLIYSPQSVMGSTLTNNVTAWWNLLGITDKNSLLAVNWDITVDFTNNWTTNFLNKVNNNYSTYYSRNVYNPEIWEAYWVYVNGAREYGWVNNPIWDEISCNINYSTKNRTNQNVVVTIDWCTWWEVFTNNSYTFTENWTHIFEYTDSNWNNWTIQVEVTRIDKNPVECTDVEFSTTTLTNNNVIATLTWCNKTIYGTKTYTFTWNWDYLFEYNDWAWNTNEKLVSVNWIDKVIPHCEVSYSPSEPTFWTVTSTIQCDKTMQEPLTYEFTDNWTNYVWLHDLAWNSTAINLAVDWIKSNLTLVQTEWQYMNTYAESDEIYVISWFLTWENKTWSDLYSFSPTYSLHIRNAQPNTSISSIVREAMLARKTNDVYYARCSRTPSWSKTDSQWNADVYLDFSNCEWNKNFFWIDNWYVRIAIRLRLWLGYDENSWATVYVDDINNTNISIVNWHYDIIWWTIHSRVITLWRSTFQLNSEDTSKIIKRWSEDVLIYSWDLSTTSNEINMERFMMTWESLFDNNLITKLYIWDELIWTKTFTDWKVLFTFDKKTIYNWEHMSIKLYWTFNSSLPLASEFHPKYSFRLYDENQNAPRSSEWSESINIDGNTYVPISWNDFIIYDDESDTIEFTRTDSLNDNRSMSTQQYKPLFEWRINTLLDNLNITSINLRSNSNEINEKFIVSIYDENENFLWSWMVTDWIATVNVNINMHNYESKSIKIYGSTLCHIENDPEIHPVFYIWNATSNGNPIESSNLPEIWWAYFVVHNGSCRTLG